MGDTMGGARACANRVTIDRAEIIAALCDYPDRMSDAQLVMLTHLVSILRPGRTLAEADAAWARDTIDQLARGE